MMLNREQIREMATTAAKRILADHMQNSPRTFCREALGNTLGVQYEPDLLQELKDIISNIK